MAVIFLDSMNKTALFWCIIWPVWSPNEEDHQFLLVAVNRSPRIPLLPTWSISCVDYRVNQAWLSQKTHAPLSNSCNMYSMLEKRSIEPVHGVMWVLKWVSITIVKYWRVSCWTHQSMFSHFCFGNGWYYNMNWFKD